MPAIAVKKAKSSSVTVVKKMRDYSGEPAFKKKAKSAIAFLKKHGTPKVLRRSSK